MSPELRAMHGLLSAEEYLQLTGAPRKGFTPTRQLAKSRQMYEYHAKRRAIAT